MTSSDTPSGALLSLDTRGVAGLPTRRFAPRAELASRALPSRRAALGLVFGAVCSGAAWAASETPIRPGERLRVSDIAPGAWRTYALPGEPIFIRRLDPRQRARTAQHSEWVVLSGLCPHLACPLRADLGGEPGFACFCHGSRFDAAGEVLRGPATQPMKHIPYALTDGVMTIVP